MVLPGHPAVDGRCFLESAQQQPSRRTRVHLSFPPLSVTLHGRGVVYQSGVEARIGHYMNRLDCFLNCESFGPAP
jgi:hypothetical protein